MEEILKTFVFIVIQSLMTIPALIFANKLQITKLSTIQQMTLEQIKKDFTELKNDLKETKQELHSRVNNLRDCIGEHDKKLIAFQIQIKNIESKFKE